MSEQEISPDIKERFLSGIFRPAITTWNRLEGRPRQEDFDRSLGAEVRDPLWMLCRQWQFGEFIGEDAGSSVKAKVQLTTACLNRYAGRDGQAVGYDERLPLEARVERETLQLETRRSGQPTVPLDLMTRARIGRHWFKLLETAGLDLLETTGGVGLKAAYLERFGFETPDAGSEAESQLRSDQRVWSTFAALRGRVVDGKRLLDDIQMEISLHTYWVIEMLEDSDKRDQLLALADQLVVWFRRVYSQPEPLEDTAWANNYLEYQFACAAPADKEDETQTVLVAEQYQRGHVDWYTFDIRPDARLPDKDGADIPAGRLIREPPLSFIPSSIEFGGMPNVRWWEFEDSKIDLGDIQASTSELATLMLAEFGLIYGNDWSLVPYDLPVGSLAQVLGVVVTDVFGVRTLVRPAADIAGAERKRWGMYHLDRLGDETADIDRRLFLPPVTPKPLESKPLERVILARDEMANMVWGVEEIIPGIVDGGVNGFEAALDLERYLRGQADISPDTSDLETDAQIRYRLGTRVPENWIPFIAVHKPDDNRNIRLQRASISRLITGLPDIQVNVEPRGAILRPGLDKEPRQPYFIHEEEVPRAGAIVTRTYQRTRWRDGAIVTWLGRRKRTGRGQGSSGLAFDQIVPLE